MSDIATAIHGFADLAKSRGMHGLCENPRIPLVSWNNRLLFAASDDGRESAILNQLWRTDGTEAGTVKVTTINPNPNGQGSISSMLRIDDLVYFPADDGIHGSELWVSDGTETGTRVVKDIYPGETTSPVGAVTPNASGPFWLTDVGGTL
jgi:ELWxxDGT repeat protein